MPRDLPFRRSQHDPLGGASAADGGRAGDRGAASAGSSELTLPEVQIPEGAPRPEDLAEHLQDYADLRCIGAGSMGVVYAAWHRPLERYVALKVLSTSLINRTVTVQRFFQEARAMARISHPRIVPVYEVAADGEVPYFTMQLVQGGSLKDLIQAEPDGRLPPRRAAEIARDIAEALAHAHREGILHRDVKPGNVLMEWDGTARLTDFGLVRQTDAMTITASDAIVGTPQYMSPEQVRGDRLDGRGDMFSLGSTLYEMLVGAPPFRSESPVGVLRAIVDHQPDSVRKHRPQVPASLEAVVMRMLEKDPARRYPDMNAAQADLERYLRGEAVEATLPSSITRAWRRLSSNKLALRFALGLVLLAGAAGFYVFFAETWMAEGSRLATAYNEAINAVRSGNTKAAAAVLATLTDEEQAEPRFLLLHAQIAQRQGDLHGALDYVARAAELEPDNTDYLERAMVLAEESRDYDEAFNWLDRWKEARLAGASSPAEGEALAAAAARRSAALFRKKAEGALEVAAQLEHLAVVPRFDVVDAPDQDPEDARIQARFNLSYAQESLNEYARWPQASRPLLTRERAYLKALLAQLEEDPEERIEAMEDALSELTALQEARNFDLFSLQEKVETIRYLKDLSEALRDATDEQAFNTQFEKWTTAFEVASGVVDSARDEVESSFKGLVQPTVQPQATGPLGRAGDALGGFFTGIFGGQDETESQ